MSEKNNKNKESILDKLGNSQVWKSTTTITQEECLEFGKLRTFQILSNYVLI